MRNYKYYSQIEINRKRETELNQLRSDMDSQNEEHEKSVGDLKKKHANAITELEEQVENLQKSKNKLEKDVHRLTGESGDLGGQLDDTQKAKVDEYYYGIHVHAFVGVQIEVCF